MKYYDCCFENIAVKFYNAESISSDFSCSNCCDKDRLFFFTNGCGVFLIEGKRFSFSDTSLLLVPALAYHALSLCECENVEFYVITFNGNSISDTVIDVFEKMQSEKDASLFKISEDVSDILRINLEKLSILSHLSKDYRCRYSKLIMSEILLLISSFRTVENVMDDDKLGVRVIKYLNEQDDKDISLDSLARHFFVSKYYLCRAFKKHNGISIHNYINHKRIMYAKKLIESGETAAAAAYKVGFGDYSAFYRAYVKILGVSPSASTEKS